MSFIYNSTYPKVRQEGFHLNSGAAQSTGGQQSQQQQQQQQQQSLGHLQPHPTPTTFDPNSLYTTGALFADAFRNPSQSQDPFRRFDNPQQQHQQHQQHQQQHQNSSGPASLDIHDELSYLNPSSTTRSVSGHSPQPPTSASEHAAPGPYSSAHDSYPKPHDIFAVNQPHLASFSLPHNRPPFSRDAFATTTTPASLHHSYGRPDFFGHQTQQDLQRHHHDQLTPQQQQQQQQFGHLNRPLSSAGDTAGIHSPLPDKFKPGGPQSPAVGPTRSRSRSRSKVSTSRTRVSKPPSLPPPDEPSGSSRGTSASRPSGIVIPGQAFTSFGAQPTSTPWFVPGDQYSAAQNGDGINGNHAYSQSFGGGSLPMGASPTTQNGGSPPTATNDAATKLALANEKRRKRRESHNAVERRRRDNINEKIQELAMLLPDEWLSDSAKTASMAGMLSGTVSGSIGGEEDTKEVKANKGVILRNSVEYIKNLLQLVQVQRTRNQQLESELAQYRNRFGGVADGIPQTNGSGLADFDGLGGMAGSGNASNGDHNSVNMVNGDEDAAMTVLLTNPLSPDADFDIKNMFPMQMGAHDNGGMGDQGQGSSIPMPLGMLVDTQSPSTPSGEGEDDEEFHRGRGRDRGSRFPSGAKKEEVNIVLS